MLADGGLCGSFSADGTGIRAGRRSHPGIGEMMVLCSASQSTTKANLKGYSHTSLASGLRITRSGYTAQETTSQEQLQEVLPRCFARNFQRYTMTYLLRSSTKHPYQNNGDRQDSLLRFHCSRWNFSSLVHSLG